MYYLIIQMITLQTSFRFSTTTLRSPRRGALPGVLQNVHGRPDAIPLENCKPGSLHKVAL